MNNLKDGSLSVLLVEIESTLEKAEAARYQILNGIVDARSDENPTATDELRLYLNSAAALLAIILDVAGMAGVQAQLAGRWSDFSKQKDGVGHTTFHPSEDWLECKALAYLESVVSGIRLARGKDTDIIERYELNKLKLLLEKIPQMLLADNVQPQGEKELRDVAHRYLEVFFTHYTRSVQIEGPVRPFKPDSGVINLKAAIEFKFAASLDEVRREIGQLFEDTSGYANSQDWNRFYCVLYQTQAFISKDRLKAELEKSSRRNWIPVLMSGPGARPTRTTKKSVGPIKSS